MDELVRFVGVLLRFPFFLIGVVLWSPFAALGLVLGPIFGIIGIPLKFVEAAWKNEKWILETHLRDLFKFDAIWEVYREMYDWWQKEKRE